MIDVLTIFSMAGVAFVIGAVFAGLALLSRRGRLKPETSRKAAHIAIGLVAVSFGWIFDETLPVVVLSAGGLLFAVAMRRVGALKRTVGPVLHSVGRRSLGDYCIPIAVPLLHWLAMPDAMYYVVPILVLTLADSAAALIGSRFGCWAYRTDDGSKTLEGSAALAAVTALVVFSALYLDSFGWQRAAAIALLMAIMVMLAEAVCWRGLDNLVLPLGSFALLKTYDTLPDEMIIARVVVSVALTAFAGVWHRKAGLIGAAGVASAFVIYACWAIGGYVWAIPPVVLLVCLPFFGARHAESRADDLGVGPVLCMSASPLAWMFLQAADAVDGMLLPFIASWAAVLGVVWIVRRRRDALIGHPDPTLTLKVLAALAGMGTLCCVLPGGVGRIGVTLAVTAAAFLLAAVAEFVLDGTRRFGAGDQVWSARALIILVVTAPVLGVVPLLEGQPHVD